MPVQKWIFYHFEPLRTTFHHLCDYFIPFMVVLQALFMDKRKKNMPVSGIFFRVFYMLWERFFGKLDIDLVLSHFFLYDFASDIDLSVCFFNLILTTTSVTTAKTTITIANSCETGIVVFGIKSWSVLNPSIHALPSP